MGTKGGYVYSSIAMKNFVVPRLLLVFLSGDRESPLSIHASIFEDWRLVPPVGGGLIEIYLW